MILTIDTCTAAVYIPSSILRDLSLILIRYLAGDLRNVALSFLGTTDIRALNLSSKDQKFKQLEKFLTNVQISIPASNGKRTKKIRGLIEHAGKFVFSKDDGQENTVAVFIIIFSIHSTRPLTISKRHFQETYNIRVQYPDIFGVNISGKNNPHPSVIPAELCQVIPGQLYKRRIPEYLTPKVVEFSKIRPQDRRRKIAQSVRMLSGLY